jgi:poly(A) polymerase
VESLVANHLRFKDVRKMRESTLKRFLRQEGFAEHLELHRLDCVMSHRLLDNYEFVKRKSEELPRAALKPRPLVTGHDLIAAGYQPGPAFSRMLAAIEDAQLEGQVREREEALNWVRARFRPSDGQPVPG